jgi:hypothetical protein
MTKLFGRCRCADRIKARAQGNESVMALITHPEFTCQEMSTFYRDKLQGDNGCESCLLFEWIDKPSLLCPKESPEATVEVPEFPIKLLPEPFSSYIKEVSKSLHCPPDYAAMPMLVYWSSIVGLKQRIQMSPDWVETCCFWGAIVGQPGSKKSPVLEKCGSFVSNIEKEARKNYRKEKREWDGREDQYKTEGTKPILKQIEINDATTEAICMILDKNPNGIICAFDELSGWLGSFDQYKPKGGSDRQFWLSVWSSAPIAIARKLTDSYYIPKPFVSIIGALLPDYLKSLKDDTKNFVDDGLSSRFLLVYPKDVKPHIDLSRYIDKDIYDAVEACFKWFNEHNLTYEESIVRLSSDGKSKKMFEEWYNTTHAQAIMTSLSDELKNHYGKLTGYVARLALLMHTMDEAREGTVETYLQSNNMERSIELIETYFKKHIEKAYYYQIMSNSERIALSLFAWFQKHGEKVYSFTEINQRFKVKGKALKIKDTAELLQSLVDMGRGIILKDKKDKKHFYPFVR